MAIERAEVRLPDRYDGFGVAKFGIDVVRFGARWTRDTVVFALEVPGRVDALLDEVSALMVRINAVVDALSFYGIQHVDMPATPQRVWDALQSVGR